MTFLQLVLNGRRGYLLPEGGLLMKIEDFQFPLQVFQTPKGGLKSKICTQNPPEGGRVHRRFQTPQSLKS